MAHLANISECITMVGTILLKTFNFIKTKKKHNYTLLLKRQIVNTFVIEY